jgi:hypothetical protein
MCGRYAFNATPAQVAEHFGLAACADFAPRFNIPPGTDIPVIRHSPEGQRVLHLLRWGLVPHWAKDPSIGNKLNNARGESVAEKPSFREAFKRRRCLGRRHITRVTIKQISERAVRNLTASAGKYFGFGFCCPGLRLGLRGETGRLTNALPGYDGSPGLSAFLEGGHDWCITWCSIGVATIALLHLNAPACYAMQSQNISITR